MNIHKTLLVAVVAQLLLFGSLQAASFDCKKAGTFIEHSICNDTKLSKLDDELALAYKNARNSGTDKNVLKKEQQDWMNKDRKSCQNVECLIRSYETRIAQLHYYSKGIVGVYKKGNVDISIYSDLTFSYDEVNPRNGNMCTIQDEKLTKKGNFYIWKDNEYGCELKFSQKNNTTLNFTFSSNDEEYNCAYIYCGSGLNLEEGEYKKVKK